jgi:hypothetical protein
MDNYYVEKVRVVSCKNGRLTAGYISVEADISRISCHTILTNKLEMRHVAAEFVPRLLSNEQKANSVTDRPV